MPRWENAALRECRAGRMPPRGYLELLHRPDGLFLFRGKFRVLLLDGRVGEVRELVAEAIFIVCGVGIQAQPEIAVVEQYQSWLEGRNQHIAPDVKLAALKEKRVFNVLLDDRLRVDVPVPAALWLGDFLSLFLGGQSGFRGGVLLRGGALWQLLVVVAALALPELLLQHHLLHILEDLFLLVVEQPVGDVLSEVELLRVDELFPELRDVVYHLDAPPAVQVFRLEDPSALCLAVEERNFIRHAIQLVGLREEVRVAGFGEVAVVLQRLDQGGLLREDLQDIGDVRDHLLPLLEAEEVDFADALAPLEVVVVGKLVRLRHNEILFRIRKVRLYQLAVVPLPHKDALLLRGRSRLSLDLELLLLLHAGGLLLLLMLFRAIARGRLGTSVAVARSRVVVQVLFVLESAVCSLLLLTPFLRVGTREHGKLLRDPQVTVVSPGVLRAEALTDALQPCVDGSEVVYLVVVLGRVKLEAVMVLHCGSTPPRAWMMQHWTSACKRSAQLFWREGPSKQGASVGPGIRRCHTSRAFIPFAVYKEKVGSEERGPMHNLNLERLARVPIVCSPVSPPVKISTWTMLCANGFHCTDSVASQGKKNVRSNHSQLARRN